MGTEHGLPGMFSGSMTTARRAHLLITLVLAGLLVAELIVLTYRGRWLHSFLVVCLLVFTAAPLARRLHSGAALIPSEIHLVGVLFAFASIFLGEVLDYYERIWWWDDALHATAGLLLGLVGFMLVYALNKNEHVDMQMPPAFIAMFAFFFSIGVGALWEIFEYAMDSFAGLTMQKPTPGDPTGLSDTMTDLIVDAVGAAAVSLAGYRYMRQPRKAYLDSWGRRFIEKHPRLFER
ncbi:hypothetical protein N6H05_25825 (plasmid) [Sphingobium sp. WTD-1]|nr:MULTISPECIES: hypothetical protein [Sphingobium]WIA59131.1 hypothetical protein N6H05_25825 [Sphingobium sp. WTD-1]